MLDIKYAPSVMARGLMHVALVLALCLSGCARSLEATVQRHIARVEHGLLHEIGDSPWKRMTLAERMAYYNVPGVSIAVIDDFQISWAKGYGVLDAGSDDPITPQTRFQVASPGKVVVAAAVLHYVEQGVLDLDADVNESLVSWHVPESPYTAEEKVTLRRLLSHSAGVTVGGFRGYAEDEAIPNLRQILDGAPPANNVPIRVAAVPGSALEYSGGGYMIVQQLLEDVIDRPFAEMMEETVLDPWGMTSSTFAWPLPEELWDVAATGHRADGRPIPGRWHTYPEMGSGASLWSTPSDLARFAIGVMSAYAGRSDDVLSQEMARLMLTPQLESRGLGPVVLDDGGDRFYFMHPGANDGYKSVLVGYPVRGQGVVIMTNSDGGDALWREILNSVSIEYGWIQDNTSLYAGVTVVIVLAVVGILALRRGRGGPYAGLPA